MSHLIKQKKEILDLMYRNLEIRSNIFKNKQPYKIKLMGLYGTLKRFKYA